MKHPTIHPNQSFSENGKRLLLWYNERAIQHLLKTTHQHEHIHEARLCFKRLRSLARLMKLGLGKKRYRELNECYRDAARLLSPYRDATALIEIVDAVLPTVKSKQAHDALLKLRKIQMQQRRHLFMQSNCDEVKKENIVRLRQQEQSIISWEMEANSAEVYASGANDVYKAGRKWLKRTSENMNDEHMHEWRKQVKHWWYVLWKLRQAWPTIFDAHAAETQVLSKLLGKHHDLFILEQALHQPSSVELSSVEVSHILTRLSSEKKRLEQEAVLLGTKVYAAKQPFSVLLFSTFE